jgi:hypothetical protein
MGEVVGMACKGALVSVVVLCVLWGVVAACMRSSEISQWEEKHRR